jgi:hypothetical protein
MTNFFLTNKGTYNAITHIYMGDQLLNTMEYVMEIVTRNKEGEKKL